MQKAKIILDRPIEVANFVANRIEQEVDWFHVGGFQAIGVERYGRIIAGFVFHGMQKNRADVWLSVAGEGAFLTSEILNFLYYNAFEVLNCAHVTCRSSRQNIRAKKVLIQAGFLLEGIQRKAWNGNIDAVLYGLTAESIKLSKGE